MQRVLARWVLALLLAGLPIAQLAHALTHAPLAAQHDDCADHHDESQCVGCVAFAASAAAAPGATRVPLPAAAHRASAGVERRSIALAVSPSYESRAPPRTTPLR